MKVYSSSSITLRVRLEATEQFEYEGPEYFGEMVDKRRVARIDEVSAIGYAADRPERVSLSGRVVKKDGTLGYVGRQFHRVPLALLDQRIADAVRRGWAGSIYNGKGLSAWSPDVDRLHAASCASTRGEICTCGGDWE